MCDFYKYNYLKYYVGIGYCVKDPESLNIVSIVNIAVNLIVAILLVVQIKKSVRKVKRISSPSEFAAYAETYSALSLFIVRLLQVSMVIGIISNAINIAATAMFGSYSQIKLTEDCFPELNYSTFEYIVYWTLIWSAIIAVSIVSLQWFEWLTML